MMGKLTKQLLQTAVHNSLSDQFTLLLERLEPRRPNLLRVLTYHRVDLAEGFEQQMRYLATNYHVVSMPELLKAWRGEVLLPPRSIMITFDDAYCNFMECAWPILKRYHLPVTVFVPTAFPDQPERIFWWDQLQTALHEASPQALETPLGLLSLQSTAQREQAFKRLSNYIKEIPHREVIPFINQLCDKLNARQLENKVLPWEKLRQLAREGVTLGAHTQTHPRLTQIDPEEAQAEAIRSLRDLEQNIGEVLPVFAYPDGGYNEAVVRLLKQAGFILAFTTVRGTNDLRQADPLRLRRINIGPRATLSVLKARLLQASIYLNQLRPVPGSR